MILNNKKCALAALLTASLLLFACTATADDALSGAEDPPEKEYLGTSIRHAHY